MKTLTINLRKGRRFSVTIALDDSSVTVDITLLHVGVDAVPRNRSLFFPS